MNQFVSCKGVISGFISLVWFLLSKLQFNVQDVCFLSLIDAFIAKTSGLAHWFNFQLEALEA